jgi:hypothetical protein
MKIDRLLAVRSALDVLRGGECYERRLKNRNDSICIYQVQLDDTWLAEFAKQTDNLTPALDDDH